MAKDNKQLIEKNLINFYISFKENKLVNFYENDFVYNIHNPKNNWPSFLLFKDYKNSFIKIQGSVSKINFISKNWIIDSEYVKKNQLEIKNHNLFPVKKWDGMFLETTKLIQENSVDYFKFEKLKTKDVETYLKLINLSIFKKNGLSKELIIDKINHPNFHFFLGKYKNEIVTTCIIFNDNISNGLYFISTENSQRKKGLGSLTVIKSINYLINKGESKFVLHATKMGNNIYTKIGFATFSKLIIFTKI